MYKFYQTLINSFLLISIQWISELRHYAPGVPVILVGTKLGKIISTICLLFIILYFCYYVLISSYVFVNEKLSGFYGSRYSF